jgi:hypothetical protein
VTHDLQRKLVCNIQGGSDGSRRRHNVTFTKAFLSLQGKTEKTFRRWVATLSGRANSASPLPPVLAGNSVLLLEATPDVKITPCQMQGHAARHVRGVGRVRLLYHGHTR